MKSNSLILLTALLSMSATNTWAKEPSPNCSGAEDDIAKLEKEKKSEGGILSYTPIALVADAVDESEKENKEEQAVKDHNDKIDAQIDAIRKTCNIQ